MQKYRSFLYMLLSICLLATISGCGKKELFVNEDDKYKVESVEQNDMSKKVLISMYRMKKKLTVM